MKDFNYIVNPDLWEREFFAESEKPQDITSGSALRLVDKLDRLHAMDCAVALKEFYSLDIQLKFTPPDTPLDCFHTWKSYQGFTENYEYCSTCDEKR